MTRTELPPIGAVLHYVYLFLHEAKLRDEGVKERPVIVIDVDQTTVAVVPVTSKGDRYPEAIITPTWSPMPQVSRSSQRSWSRNTTASPGSATTSGHSPKDTSPVGCRQDLRTKSASWQSQAASQSVGTDHAEAPHAAKPA